MKVPENNTGQYISFLGKKSLPENILRLNQLYKNKNSFIVIFISIEGETLTKHNS